MAGPDLTNSEAFRAIRAKQAEAEAARAVEPKVISISTRKVYEATVDTLTATVTNGRATLTVKPKRVRVPKVDKEAIASCEELLAKLKAGEVTGFLGVVACKGERKGFFDLHLRLPAGPAPEQEALRWLGVLDLMKADLLDIVEFGADLDDSDELGEVILMSGDDE